MEFSFDRFSACLNDSFRLLSADTPVELTLVSVERLPGQEDSISPTSYTVLFESPPGPVLPQRMYRLAHPEQGEFDLFIVPIGADDTAVRYEAVFS